MLIVIINKPIKIIVACLILGLLELIKLKIPKRKIPIKKEIMVPLTAVKNKAGTPKTRTTP